MQFLGVKPAPIPWILCGPGCPPEITGLASGSTATVKSSLRPLITSETPVIVPPVPTPDTNASIVPSVADQISSAVVWRCTSGFAGFSNCCGIKAFSPYSSTSSPARAIAPGIPLGPGVKTISAPSIFNNTRRSTDIVSGIVKIKRYPLAAQINARAIPVFPEVGSITMLSLLSFPSRSAASIIARPILSFTLASGLKNSHLR